MKIRFSRFSILGITLLAVALQGLSSVSQPTAPTSSKEIVIDGSSTVAPITQAVAREFNRVRPDVNISVGVSGTSGGFTRFLNSETDISDASRPIKTSEIEKATQNNVSFIESLVAFDGLTVAVDRDTKIFGSTAPCMTVGELSLLWSREADGFITQWSQLGSRFADAKITLSGAAETSGTFDFFTEAVNGKSGDTRSDYFGTEEDQLLAEQTGANDLALSYFGFAFFVSNQDAIRAVAIDPRRDLIDTPQGVLTEINARRAANSKSPLTNGGESCSGIPPTLDTILSFQYAPLSRPLFIYTNAKSTEREALEAFLEFFFDDEIFGNEEFMQDVGYVTVTEEIRDATRACFEDRITGTAFDGTISGLTGEQLVEKFQAHCGL